jgi:hypothetical protein
MARDISTLASWFGRVYANSTTGLLDTWKYLLQLSDAACSATADPEIVKLPLPTSASIGSVQPHTFAHYSKCPDSLRGLDRKETYTVLELLISTLNRDFSTNLVSEKILPVLGQKKPITRKWMTLTWNRHYRKTANILC